MTDETYYKVTNKGGEARYGTGKWNLPRGRPGKWMPEVADIQVCVRGYHLCREQDLIQWLGPEIYEAEGRGNRIVSDNKVVFSEARLVRRVKLWTPELSVAIAADFAEHVLHIFEERYPEDDRPRKAIEAAKSGAYAAYAAADAADAAYAADAADAAAYAADAADAAADAARAAADAAAADASRQAECEWQTSLLMQYLRGEKG